MRNLDFLNFSCCAAAFIYHYHVLCMQQYLDLHLGGTKNTNLGIKYQIIGLTPAEVQSAVKFANNYKLHEESVDQRTKYWHHLQPDL